VNIVLLHNRYREPGGEERSVREITDLLLLRGHQVQLLERSSAPLTGIGGRLRAGAALLRGGRDPAGVAAAVARSGAEVLHAHNVTPLFGSRALAAASRAGAKVVMHLHNYRLFCSIAIGYRDGGACTRCRGRNTLPGARLNCRGERVESAVYAAGIALHQEAVLDSVARFVVPSHAAARRLAQFGLPAGRMDVLHNFLPDSEFEAETSADGGEYALFAGRLAEEKGVDTVIEASRLARVPLAVAGAGPEQKRLERQAKLAGAPVTFLGRLSPAEMRNVRRRAAFAVVPSRWDEPCPYAAIEAMAAGLPVLASAVGGLPEMVDAESSLPPGSPPQWAEAMESLWKDPATRRDRGGGALRRGRELFGAERFYSGLMRVYEGAAT
jgi:glycosyltransferase involved in cell wall biosynthesis